MKSADVDVCVGCGENNKDFLSGYFVDWILVDMIFKKGRRAPRPIAHPFFGVVLIAL